MYPNQFERMFPETLGYLIWQMLEEKKALKVDLVQQAFVVWAREDRIVVIFNPQAIVLGKINEGFAHDLATMLRGKKVARMNSRGIFLQVGYNIPKAPVQLTVKNLELSGQPGAWDLPIGHTERGDLWIPLMEMDSALVGGSRGNGKTGLLHTWIQALLEGGKTLVYAWDGKENVEFLRYAGRENFRFIPMHDLREGLLELKELSTERLRIVLRGGYPSVAAYNEAEDEAIMPVALVIDEVALADEKELLVELVERHRAGGIYPILATNRPNQASILVKANLTTRICFAVPSWQDSQMVLGRNGAEKLPKEPGRGLIEWKGRMLEFQTFMTEYPEPNEEAVQAFLEAQLEAVEEEQQSNQEVEDRVIALHQVGSSMSAIVREIWNVSGGSVFLRRIDEVKAILGTTTTSETA